MSPRAIILSAVGLIAMMITGIVGYYLFIEVDKVHQQNVSDLASFGSKVVPLSSREGADGVTFGTQGGNIQLPPSLQQKKLSPTEKVILSLSRDKDQLLVEISELTEQVELQYQRLSELQAYKAENERFAPKMLQQERERAQTMLKGYFDNSSDVTHLTPFQQLAISLATANIYTEVVRQHQLILDDRFKDSLIKLLPSYGLCLSGGLPFVANDPAEERIIIKALKTDSVDQLQGGLAKDYNSIHHPCLSKLNLKVNQLLDQHLQNSGAIQLIAEAGNSDTSSQAESSGPAITADMSPTEQLIQTLSFEKTQSLAKATELKALLKRRALELVELKQYHDNSARYAPLPTLEERDRAYSLLNAYFEETDDASRFNSFEKQAMSLSAANTYAAMIKRNRLVLTEPLKDRIIHDHLPNYGFCFGDGLKFVIDNRLQQRQLINALREQDKEYMGTALAGKIDAITTPCSEQLSQQLVSYF